MRSVVSESDLYRIGCAKKVGQRPDCAPLPLILREMPACTIGSVDHDKLRLMHENLIHGLTSVNQSLPSAETAHLGPWILGDSGITNPDVNQAIIAAPVDDPVAAIRSAADWYRERDTLFSFVLRDSVDAAVVQAAIAAGYVERRSQPAMLLPVIRGPVSPTGQFDIRRVVDGAGVEGYVDAEVEEPMRHQTHREPDAELAKAVLALVGVELFVGYVDGVAVARSMLVLSGEMAGINNVYVAPSVRKQGWGWAITEAAITTGADLGANAACLNASRMGQPLYERMGFREVYRYLGLSKADD